MRPFSLGAALCLAACAQRPALWSVPAADPATERTLTSGRIVGGPGRYDSHAWLGIPFAAPPLGDLRWRTPRPPTPWTQLRQTLSFAPGCPQFASPLGGVPGSTGEVVGNEDCLYLNVWTPPFAPSQVPSGPQRLPVMVWIHGGADSIRTASFFEGGRLATSQKVMVVTIQYRLGPLGWFRHRALRAESKDPLEQSGNFGTLDTMRALEWVRENASAFGGDPGNVTVFGESAGGENVFALLVAPSARGLFHRAIVESGGASRVTLAEAEHFADDPFPGHKNSSNEVLARLLGDRVRAVRMPNAEAAAFLRAQSPSQLLGAYARHHHLGMLDMPVVIRDGALLPTEDWVDRMADPQGWNRVPVILGSNRDELRIFLFLNPEFIHLRFGILPRFVDQPRYEGSSDALSRMWKATAVDAPAAAMARSGATAVYAYRFDWRGEPTFLGADLSKMVGAAHGMELPFVFGHFDLGPLAKPLFDDAGAAERKRLSEVMMGYWGNFARTGVPGGQGLPAWTSWNEAPSAPKFVLLDSPRDRIQMSSAVEERTAIIADVDADPRLPDLRDKCRVFHEMTGWTHGFERNDYPRAGAHGCTAFPFERYPWREALP